MFGMASSWMLLILTFSGACAGMGSAGQNHDLVYSIPTYTRLSDAQCAEDKFAVIDIYAALCTSD